MPTFDELIARIVSSQPEGFDPTPYDDLSASYTGLSESAAAAAAVKDARIAELEAEINSLKAHNYDLLMAVDNAAGKVDNVTDNEDPDDADEDDLSSDGYDELFE